MKQQHAAAEDQQRPLAEEAAEDGRAGVGHLARDCAVRLRRVDFALADARSASRVGIASREVTRKTERLERK